MQKIVGIDVSSKKLNIHFLHNGENFEIPNKKESIEEFIKEQKLKRRNIVAGCESTRRYHLNCQNIFVKSDIESRVINPILTNNKIRLTVRQKKTDISDAQLIAQILQQG